MPYSTPFEVGVKAGGGGFHPLFKSVGARILEPQPEAETPDVKPRYFTTTHRIRPRKPMLYSTPFEPVRNAPDAPFKQSKYTYHGGDQNNAQANWKNNYANVYKETTNSTENRMLQQRQGAALNVPIQWVKPEHTRYYDRSRENMTQRFADVARENERAKVEELRLKGLSDEEIKTVLSKQRERYIEKAISDPLSKDAAMEGLVAKLLSVSSAMAEHYPNEGISRPLAAPINNKSSQQILQQAAQATPAKPYKYRYGGNHIATGRHRMVDASTQT